MNIVAIKKDAKRLRAELANRNVNLSSSASQDLIAISRGAADWNTLVAASKSRYFYDKHSAFLPNAPLEVSQLGGRAACLEDMASIRVRFSRTDNNALPHWLLAIKRAIAQIEMVYKSLDVPEMNAVLDSSLNSTRLLNMRSYQSAMTFEQCLKTLSTSTADACAKPAEGLIKRYSAAYADLMLVRLGAARRRLGESKQNNLEGLVTGGCADLYATLADLYAPSADRKLGSILVELSKSHRANAKAVFLNLLSCGSQCTLNFDFALNISSGELASIEDRIRFRFPEIEMWQTWCQLKPLLAPGIDKVSV